MRNGLPDHWAEILGLESRQVNEGDGVDLLPHTMVGEKSPLHSQPGSERSRLLTTATCANVPIMTDIEPEILALAKREYGDNCELARRTEWSFSFKYGLKSYSSISRFMVEKDFEVSVSEIRQRWPSMREPHLDKF